MHQGWQAAQVLMQFCWQTTWCLRLQFSRYVSYSPCIMLPCLLAVIAAKSAELEAAVSSAPKELLLAKPGRHSSSIGTDLWSQPTAQSLESRAPPRPEPDGDHWVTLLF